MAVNTPAVATVARMMSGGAEELIKVGMDREDVARGMLLAALKVVYPIADLAQQAEWLRKHGAGARSGEYDD